ncbi:MAG TPA: phosphoglycerate kinase, partial [Longimicrobiales bacterium]|nr:phosphoglycerate kinase [Longimicrobiales bacterium]
MPKMRLRDLPDAAVQRHRVLVRVDYNVPIEDGRITDDTRIRGTLPTLQHLLDREARIILVSHLGRPKGKWNTQYSLRPVAERLRRTVSAPVHFVEDIAGPAAHEAADRLAPG